MQPRKTTRDLEVWWLHPAWMVLLMGLILIPVTYLIPEWMYREYWRVPKLITERIMWIGLACVGAFAAGALAGSTRSLGAAVAPEGRFAWTQDLPWPLLLQAFQWSFYLTLFGYAVWATSAVMRGLTPALALGVLHGEKGAAELVKDVYLVTISGVTTTTQFGHLVVVLGGIIGCVYGWKHVRRQIAVVFALAVVRALLNSERLAIIELAIPLALVLIRLAVLDSPKVIGLVRILVQTAPVYASAVLLALFGASEYFRSWLNFYKGGKLSFLEFISLRLLGYYVTAINNGALLVERIEPTGAPFFTMRFLFRFPVLSGIMGMLYPYRSFASDTDPYLTILDVGANVEFNNGDGYLLPILDYGVFGALLYWLMAGLLCGWLYRQFCRKHTLGLFVYPVAFIGITEMPRVIYWGEGRTIPALFFLSLLSYVCTRYRERAQDLKWVQMERTAETIRV